MISDMSLWLKLLMAIAVAAVVSFLMTPPVKRFAEKVGAIDVQKDERRVHNHPIPRMGGLAIFIVAFGAYLLTEILHINALSGALIWVALVVGGAANMFITVNTLPLVLEIGGIDKVGTFTGYYYTATFSAQIATPIIYGIVRMLTGTYMSLFYYCPIAFILSTLCILVVRHGEAIPDEIVEKIKEENED